MTEFYVIIGDALEQLRTLPDESAQCCVTSPPYWGLRDYGVPGQQGLEASPDEYVARMVAVFREVRRVLHSSGTCWVNIGDSYAGGGAVGSRPGGGAQGDGHAARAPMTQPNRLVSRRNQGNSGARAGRTHTECVDKPRTGDLKPKDLVGIPWMLAFALRADGWYLRQEIIWHKPNPMPESVRDRCTKSHEHVFLLSKSARYYYDADAIAEPVSESTVERLSQPTLDTQQGSARVPGKTNGNMMAVGGTDTRNKRDVWTMTTKPSGLEHFAAFPPELPETCIRAGTKTSDTVLDPFSGTGTTGIVAVGLNRRYIGCELNPKYAEMSLTRYREARGLFAAPAP